MKVTVTNEYTTPGGRKYKAGTSVEVDNALGRSLIARGKATAADTSAADAGEPTSAAAETKPARDKGKE